MKKITIFLMLTLSIFTFNIVEASFPVTKQVVTENVNLNDDTSSSFIEEAATTAPSAGGMEWGAFALGLLLGIAGVLIVWIIGGDTTSAWKGLAAWIVLLLLLL